MSKTIKIITIIYWVLVTILISIIFFFQNQEFKYDCKSPEQDSLPRCAALIKYNEENK